METPLYHDILSTQIKDFAINKINIANSIFNLNITGQIINLTLTAATFQAINSRLRKLDLQIEKLSKTIQSEFSRDRHQRFFTALEAARDVFETKVAATREKAIRNAIDGLYEAKENFLSDFNETLQKEITNERLFIAQQYLIRAFYAELSRIRCYLIDNDVELAKQRLQEDSITFKTNTERLIKLWLGQHPAVYFHKEVKREDLLRFIRIQNWLQDISHSDLFITFNIIDEMRSDFWNENIIQDEYDNMFGQFARRPARKFADRVKTLAENLTQCELLIENFERLQGFEMEIRTMRLSFPEWANLVSDKEFEKNGIGIILDIELLEELQQKRTNGLIS